MPTGLSAGAIPDDHLRNSHRLPVGAAAGCAAAAIALAAREHKPKRPEDEPTTYGLRCEGEAGAGAGGVPRNRPRGGARWPQSPRSDLIKAADPPSQGDHRSMAETTRAMPPAMTSARGNDQLSCFGSCVSAALASGRPPGLRSSVEVDCFARTAPD